MKINKQESTFKNEPTRRFYSEIKRRIDKDELTLQQVAELFKKGDKPSSNPSSYLSKMRSGDNGVTVEQITIAQQQLNISPSYIFGELDANPHVLTDSSIDYGIITGDPVVGEILHKIFKKHKTEVKTYAEKRLKISEQQLHNFFSGRSRIFFDTVCTICEDHAESLDQFRAVALPKGHLLEENKNLKALVHAQQLTIDALQKLNK